MPTLDAGDDETVSDSNAVTAKPCENTVRFYWNYLGEGRVDTE